VSATPRVRARLRADAPTELAKQVAHRTEALYGVRTVRTGSSNVQRSRATTVLPISAAAVTAATVSLAIDHGLGNDDVLPQFARPFIATSRITMVAASGFSMRQPAITRRYLFRQSPETAPRTSTATAFSGPACHPSATASSPEFSAWAGSLINVYQISYLRRLLILVVSFHSYLSAVQRVTLELTSEERGAGRGSTHVTTHSSEIDDANAHKTALIAK
jgi:hypothetical protein